MPLASLTEILKDPYVLAILVYLLALVGVGWLKARKVKGGEDFMVAGRTLPWYILVGTLLATWIGNGSLFGGAGSAIATGSRACGRRAARGWASCWCSSSRGACATLARSRCPTSSRRATAL